MKLNAAQRGSIVTALARTLRRDADIFEHLEKVFSDIANGVTLSSADADLLARRAAIIAKGARETLRLLPTQLVKAPAAPLPDIPTRVM